MDATMIKWIKRIAILLVVLILAARVVYVNRQDMQTIIVSLGVYKYTVSEPGVHFKYPWQSRIRYSTRITSYNSPAVETITRDKQNLIFDTVTLYKITDPYKYYVKFRNAASSINYINDVVYNSIRILAGKYNFYDLIYLKRDEILKEAIAITNESTSGCGITVENITFRRVFFPESNLSYIYTSMIAERQQVAETYRIEGQAEYDKIVSEAEKYMNVETAKAKSQAAKIIGEAEAKSQAMIQDTMNYASGLYEIMKTYEVYLSSMDNIKMIFKPDGYFFNGLKGY